MYNVYERLDELKEIEKYRRLTDEEYIEKIGCMQTIQINEAERDYLNGRG